MNFFTPLADLNKKKSIITETDTTSENTTSTKISSTATSSQLNSETVKKDLPKKIDDSTVSTTTTKPVPSIEKVVNDETDDKKVTEKSIQQEIDEQQEKNRKESERRKILWRKSRPDRVRAETLNHFKLIDIKRITKVTKGGRRFRFFAVGLAGDKKGKIGIGFGKANEIASARIKAFAQAEKHMIRIAIVNDTIPHHVEGRFCSSHVFFKPAIAGSGIVIGGASRTVIELLGIKNIRGKSLGSNNKMNLIQATMKALKMLRPVSEWKALRLSD